MVLMKTFLASQWHITSRNSQAFAPPEFVPFKHAESVNKRTMFKRLRNLSIAVITVISMCGTSFAEGTTEYPQDGQIPAQTQEETDKVISEMTEWESPERFKTMEKVAGNSANYSPLVLYALASAYLYDGKANDKGEYWFFAAQLRSGFDITRCKKVDDDAFETRDYVNSQLATVNERMTAQKYETLIPQILEWDKKTPHNYDHRWIGSEFIPKGEWEELNDRYRARYWKACSAVIAGLKAGKPREETLKEVDKIESEKVKTK